MKLHIDFETRSAVDLKKCGVHVYAEHWSTDIICLGWMFDGEEPQISGWMLPDRVIAHITAGGQVVAHNASFELAIWNTCCTRKYNWPSLRPEQIDCTMARAYAMNLPGSLDAAAAAVGLEVRKDSAGHRLMLKMSQPKSVRQLPNLVEYTWHEEAEQLERLYAYCKQDLLVEAELDKRLLALSPYEKKLWVIDHRINNRGVQVDTEAVKKAMVVVDSEVKRLNAEIREVTGDQVATYNSHQQLKDWLRDQGVEVTGVAKDAVVTMLASPTLPSACRRALEIRQEAAKSSTSKLKAMLAGANGDSRLKGMLQYHGAGQTGRWSGRRVQLQNLPRLTECEPYEIEDAFKLLEHPGAADQIALYIGPPMTVVSEMLRGMLRSAPGKDLLAVDYNAIEARVLAWLSGEHSVLDIFLSNQDVYKVAASAIFSVPIDKVTDEQRQVGKVAILALGYQGGVGAFQTMARVYGVKMAPALRPLWDVATSEQRERAMGGWRSRGLQSGINKQEWIASELTKLAWRENNPNIVAYWSNVEEAAIHAVRNPGVVAEVTPLTLPRVKFKMRGSFLFCQLPSGRSICYPYPEVTLTKTKWGTTRAVLSYKFEHNHHWVRGATYGGSLVENITQAVARDCLAHGIVWCEENGYPVVMHVHDEIVPELPKLNIPKGSVDYVLKELERKICELPSWAHGLPLKAKGWRAERYRK